MLILILAVLICLCIAWAIIGKLPNETQPVSKWGWYAITQVIAIVFLLYVAGVHLP
jgi:bacteriorhodopsin